MGSNRCERSDCERKGRFTPVLIMRDPGGTDRFVEFIVMVRACREHAVERTVDQLMTPAGWANLVGRLQPRVDFLIDKVWTTIDWRPREGQMVLLSNCWQDVRRQVAPSRGS